MSRGFVKKPLLRLGENIPIFIPELECGLFLECFKLATLCPAECFRFLAESLADKFLSLVFDELFIYGGAPTLGKPTLEKNEPF